jgi:rRNA small subunit pseudouridine methyltransferase Nep1
VLVDSEIELVPKTYWSHPAVVLNAKKRKKKPSRVLLDTNLHHSLFQDPSERNRRGRPDIIHQFLLIGLESMLNMDGGLRLYVHTRNDELITISPETRIPKNYNRFCGLFEELFRTGAVPSGREPLISIQEKMGLEDVVSRVKEAGPGSELVISMDPGGEMINPIDLIDGSEPAHMICLIGGFSSGDFISDISKISEKMISFHQRELKAWSVEMEIVSLFYNGLFRGNRTSEGA